MRLSCCEIRHLFWQLVVIVERNAQALLHWSMWRRWHQAWARYYHTRQRERARDERSVQPAQMQPEEVEKEERLQASLTDILWRRLEPLLPPTRRAGHPYDHDRRVVLEAIVYVMQTHCGWQHLPEQFPPWKTVYAQYAQWRKKGIWEIIWSGVEKPLLSDELQL